MTGREHNRSVRGRRAMGLSLVAAGLALMASWFVVNPAGASGLDGTVVICRATRHDDRPYERATVTVRSLIGDASTPGSLQAGPIWYAGAGTFGISWGDIVPPLADVYPDGHNWSEGSRIWGDDCKSGTPPTSGAPSTTGCTTTLPPTTTGPSSTTTSVAESTTTAVATSLVTTTAAATTTTTTTTTVAATTTAVAVSTSSSTTTSTTTAAGTTNPATTNPATTAPASSVGPPLPPSSSIAPTSAVPDSSVSPPVIPQAGSNTFALLIVGILLVLVGAVIALTSAHA